ncbi:MAG: hypothetical protein M1449_12775 [Candidatus Thermoplasmatota archaeon]|nr:hypothetical protein [Candidatus Thermoplasmatota archaeon]
MRFLSSTIVNRSMFDDPQALREMTFKEFFNETDRNQPHQTAFDRVPAINLLPAHRCAICAAGRFSAPPAGGFRFAG